MELKIVSALQRAGATDNEIFAYFDHYKLPRYTEEGKSRSWLLSLIKRSNSSRKTREESSTQSLRVIENEHNREKQSYRDGLLVHQILRLRAAREREGHRPILTEWHKEIIEVSSEGVTKPLSLMTARRMSEALVDQGYVRLEPLNKKSKLVLLTEKGWSASELVRGRWGRYIDLWLSPAEIKDDPLPTEAGDRLPDTRPTEDGRPAVRRPRRQASGQTSEIKRISTLRKDNQINGSYRLRFKRNKIRYIQMLTPPDEWVGGDLWLQLQVEFDSEGLPEYLTLLAEEDRNDDPISSLVPRRWKARADQVVAMAAELEETDSGYRLAEYLDERGELCPAVGVIVQSSANFFTPLHSQPFGQILRVRGVGAGKRRRYSFCPVADGLPLPTDLEFDHLVSEIENPAHRDRIAQLPAGWFHMPLKRKALVQQLLGFPT